MRRLSGHVPSPTIVAEALDRSLATDGEQMASCKVRSMYEAQEGRYGIRWGQTSAGGCADYIAGLLSGRKSREQRVCRMRRAAFLRPERIRPAASARSWPP